MCVNLSWELKKTNHSVPHACNVFQQSETCFTEDCPGRMSPQDFVSLIMGHYVTNVPCVIGSSLPNTIEFLLANWSLLLASPSPGLCLSMPCKKTCHPVQAGKIAAPARDCQTSLGRWADDFFVATLMVQQRIYPLVM